MPFGVVRGVGQGMGVLDAGGDRRRGRASFEVNLVRPVVTNGAFVTRSSQVTLRTCWLYNTPCLKICTYCQAMSKYWHVVFCATAF